MNEGESAGGGHQGLNLAPPAVTDRRSTIASNPNQRLYSQTFQGGAGISGSAVIASSSVPSLQPIETHNSVQNEQQKIVGFSKQQKPLHTRVLVTQVSPHTYSQQLSTIGTISSRIQTGNLVPSNTTSVVNQTHLKLPTSSSNINSIVSTILPSLQPATVSHGNFDQSSANRKRLRVEGSVEVSITSEVQSTNDDISALKKRILEYKYSRLRSVKEKYSEHVAELFFLQTGGSMMEYPTWRKKPPTSQFINFTNSYRLDGSVSTDDAYKLKTTSSDISEQNLPQGAEIKIPSVGATPVAVSTTLPAAVVQLTQQGGTPILPDVSNIPNSIAEKQRLAPATRVLGNASMQNTLASGGGNNSQEQFSVKAKQEVYVMQRISELQREGLWTEKRLPKLQEPSRPKAHWDYLLEEMVWLAADFAQERKWKKSAAKKCARMVQKYFQDKASAAQKAEKAQELHLKRVAAFIAKEVKMFWSNVEKFVEYKHHTKLEEKRKKALDQHLSFIVDQTEKFSQQLTEGMNRPTVDVSAAPSINSSRISSPKHKSFSDDEFCPTNELSEDDEETIAKAEAEVKSTDVDEEVAALQKESEMQLEDFLKELPKDYLENRDKIVLGSNSDSSSDDEEFKANENSTDDEDTIREQESAEKNIDHKKELDELNAENEMSLEELMAKYKGPITRRERKVQPMEIEDSDDGESENSEFEDETEKSESETEDNCMLSTSESDGEGNAGLKSLLAEERGCEPSEEDKDNLINDAAAIAESIQPKGNTLSSTDVVTPVPFLLKHTLREYQHIGLDWLVTMHDRKLNGILADEMGLGKTIQTISLLAHLACMKGNWGPHLIVVPSSVMLNWEMEFKKWCPGFKILTYYGTQKERKQKRIGWTKVNAFHVCITSYKLVIQDQQSFRRKKWKYLILDEAQNIKNFKSQRWQLLLNFQTERRLLLTGTPLQNNLMELWSLMHFLMPHVFQSHREFKEWFSNPMTGMIEGNSEYNESIIKRLHKVLRPFLLRRLKAEVEKQMPKKYEHVVMCRLSKRQRYLYDDFMNRAKTRETLEGGNLLSVINVLMQLRKVCNHPNLFEVRPTISPFRMEGISLRTASLVCNMLDYDPLKDIDLNSLNLILIQLEDTLSAYVSHRVKKLATPRKLIEEINTLPDLPPKCPNGKYKFHVRVKDMRIQRNLINHSGVKVGTSPAMKTEGNKLVPVLNIDKKYHNTSLKTYDSLGLSITNASVTASSTICNTKFSTAVQNVQTAANLSDTMLGGSSLQSIGTSFGLNIRRELTSRASVSSLNIQRATASRRSEPREVHSKALTNSNASRFSWNQSNSDSQVLVATLAQQLKSNSLCTASKKYSDVDQNVIDPDFCFSCREKAKKENQQNRLQLLAKINARRCDSTPVYGLDFRESIASFTEPISKLACSTWLSRSYTNCSQAMLCRDNWSLGKLLKSHEDRIVELVDTVKDYVLFVPAVSAPAPDLHASHLHPSKLNEIKIREETITGVCSSKLRLLHPIISAMATQFPDPRLIQYDCGKLQTLNRLLRQLKTEGHRVLIFTQMAKMLDVLEAFLNYHGHIYLRLDGTTRIDQRQILMERFNADKRIFAFILSTRSGGVGVNLTGADTVIFYDSDWNPTMDAQAQDRCHRIGQTRDVHIYRLVSEKTIEENILKKANQKRMLGDLAIEGGNFTTAYFKSSTIQDLFHIENDEDPSVRLSEVIDRDRERKHLRLPENQQTMTAASTTGNSDEKTTLGVFESALAAAEDEQDVEAATTAKAEVAAELAEFDENIPLEDVDTERTVEVSKADQEFETLVKQLSPIERYAMRFVEETGGAWTAQQLRAAEAEIEQQKREWEANRIAALQKEEESRRIEEQEDEFITYSREDAKNQVWICSNRMETMPMWCPPTPPQTDNDIYIDHSLTFLYEIDIMPESHLPPVYMKKECKRSRTEAGFYGDSRRPLKIRKEDSYYAPRSLFDRPSPALAKIRRDLKLQRYRGVFKPNVQIPGLKQPYPLKPLTEPEGMTEWCIYEDIAILHVLQNLQGLPLNLMLLSPGHTPNWDLVAEIVNQFSRTHRSPKQCKYRYEAVIVPREEGKLLESPKKQKKLKTQMKSLALKSGVRSMKTSQLFISDNNNSFTKLSKVKFDNVKAAFVKKAPPPKQIFGVQTQKNSKHAAVLSDFGVTNYDCPLNPIEIALKKAEKLKEKQRNTLTISSAMQHPPEQQTIVQQPVPLQQQPTAIAVQQPSQVANIVQQPVAQMMQTSPLSRQTQQNSQISVHQSATQIVKTIVTPTTGIITSQVPQISQQSTQQMQLQHSHLQTVGTVPQSSLPVVLSTSASTLSNVQHQASQSAQIVSLQQQNIASTSTIITQPTNANMVQTISTQAIPQVVSVSQLAAVGSVLATSASLQASATVTTLNASGLRTQRLVAAPSQLQEVVLQQRSNSQSPTIVSMSGLGQAVTQPQLQAAQLRLAQQVIAKGITVGSLQQTGKLTNQSAAIQLYRQQPIRQHLKVLQTSTGQPGAAAAVVQTAGGQTTIVNASGTIIQGGIVPTGQTVQVQGQKIASVGGANVVSGNSGVVTSVAAVQVAPVQSRTQYIKQIGVGGKQTITRQVGDNEMLLVKRPTVGQHKSQVIPQSQIYAQTNVQVQPQGTSGQQQIAALVKTSQGSVAGSVGVTLSQLKPGPIKVTMANQNQVRQLQLQQQIAIAQQRKAGKTQIAQVTGKAGVSTQLIVQNTKNLPSPMAVQQIQQVIRHAQPSGSIGGQLVLGKTSVGRVIPVSVASQANARQTIQVVSAASAQALATGNIRAHVTNQPNLTNTIKVTGNQTQVHTQQALINALQQSQQNQQRQNASPVRLQTSGASLVAVPVQQVQTSANISSSSTGSTIDVATLAHQQQHHLQQQPPPK